MKKIILKALLIKILIGCTLSSILYTLIISPDVIYCQQDSTLFKDSSFYFEVQLPSSWDTEQTENDSSILRIKSIDPDKSSLFLIYCIRTNGGDVDLDKLSNIDTELFQNLGELVNTNKTDIFTDSRVEKSYKNEGVYTHFIFKVDNFIGYILVCRSLSESKSDFKKFENSLKINVPYWTSIKNRLPSVSSIVMNIIVAILLFAIPVGLALLSALTAEINKILNFITIAILTGGTIYFIWDSKDVKLSLIIGGIVLVIMIFGRFGALVWFEGD